MNASNTIVCIIGPTASGKTDLAVELVKRFDFEIISVDSAMVYKDMDIGTAKPERAVLDIAPHHLIDFLDPALAYSTAAFRDDALREIADIFKRGKTPLLVGGTMLYFKSLLYGLSEMPSADEQLRSEIMSQAEQLGWHEMHRRLALVDPDSAQRIHPNDPQRISRALEVYELSGIPLSHWQARPAEPFPYAATSIGLMPSERSWLHERIGRRFHVMLEQGFAKEVQALIDRGDLDENRPSIRAVGYRQMWQYLHGLYDYKEMQERGVAATRQLAKRQLTWMRSMPDMVKFDCINNNLLNDVLNLCRQIPINDSDKLC
jgi:tRNA dimethylallyltransferase